MDTSPTPVPPSFADLFQPEGRGRPLLPWAAIAERHELCEDMAQMLVETARDRLFDLGIGEDDVLLRIRQGLLVEGSPVSAGEATWVACRLAELLGWPLPAALCDDLPAATRQRLQRPAS